MSRKNKERIYLDYAASTPLDPRVKEAMEPYWKNLYGNAGSRHEEGRDAALALSNARVSVAKILGVKGNSVYFTSGGTESNNLAILGFLKMLQKRGELCNSHIITTAIEHPSVLEIFGEYKKQGLDVDFAPVKKDGLIDIAKFKSLLKKNTVLVSIMYVNSEIGAIEPLKKISVIIKKNNPRTIFHTDASQAPLYLRVNADSLGVDMMTLDGQKIYGPKGIGILYKNERADLEPVYLGGLQERGLRPGTENIPLIIGFAKALEIAETERKFLSSEVKKLRDYFIDGLLTSNPKAVINGGREKSVPNNVNISIIGEDSEFLQAKLDAKGIACSTKSACMEEKSDESYVLKAIGARQDDGLRFSLGRETKMEDIDCVIKTINDLTQ